MKRIIGIFTLVMLLFHIFVPSFTYATGELEDAPIEQKTSIVTDNTKVLEGQAEFASSENLKGIETNEIINETVNDEEGVIDNNIDSVDIQLIQSVENIETLSNNNTMLLEDGSNTDFQIQGNDDTNWYECFGITSGTESANVNSYNCSFTNIIIPENISYLSEGVFKGKNIDSLTFMSGETRFGPYSLSGAKINSDLTLPGNQPYDVHFLEGSIITKDGRLTVKKNSATYMIENHGELIIDGTEGSYTPFLNNSLIDGNVIFTGFNNFKLYKSFQGSEITTNGNISFDDKLYKIEDSFTHQNGVKYNEGFYGKINYPDGIIIDSSFNYNITGLELKNKILYIDDSFNSGNSYGVTISGDINVNKINYSFVDSTINGSINIEKNDLYTNDDIIYNTKPKNVKGNLNISGNNLKFGTSNFNKTNFGGNLILTGENIEIISYIGFDGVSLSGDLIINSNRIKIGSFLEELKIYGDVKLSGNTIDLDGFLGMYNKKGSIISGNVLLTGSNIEIKGGTLSNAKIGKSIIIKTDDFTETNGASPFLSISGDFIVNSNNSVLLTNGCLSNLKISRNFKVNGNSCTAQYGSLQNIVIDGDINFECNTISGPMGGFTNAIGYNISFKGKTIEASNGNFGTLKALNNFTIEADDILLTKGGFQYSSAKNDFIISGKNIDISLGALNDMNIGNNLIIKSNNLEDDGSLYALKISGDVNINSNNLKYTALLSDSFVGKNMIIKSNVITGVLSADSYYEKKGTMSGMNILGDFIMEGNSIYLDKSIKNSNFGGDFNLYGDNITFNNAILYKSNINGDLRLPKGIVKGDNHDQLLDNLSITGNLILGGPNQIKQLYQLGNLIIEDGNNAQENIFNSYIIPNNQVTINGTLSNIGTHAYSFKEGTRIINTITLSDHFSTGDIGDGAFCIQNEPDIKVNAVSAKKFTQEERQDLYDRTCINLSYSGTHNLLLKVDGKEGIAVYDGLHEVEIPNGLKESGYNIKWYSNPELTGAEVNLNNQSFEEYEYTKTIYGKYIEIPVTPAAGGGSTINPSKQGSKTTEQEHNSADKEETTKKDNTKSTTNKTTDTSTIKENVKKIEGKTLTRGEVAVMTNILLDVYPQLTENKTLNEVSEACENYADEQNFTKDEKKAITRLCKLSIMGIHRDTKEPLDEFMVKQLASNDEFAIVMDRAVANYTEKDLSVVKEALKKLEGNEENVVFGTVYDVFMSIKNIFN